MWGTTPTGACRPEPVFRARRGLPVGLLVTAPTPPAGLGAQRPKRVFGIDIATCQACGGAVRLLACIEDPVVIEKFLTDLDTKAAEPQALIRPPSKGCRYDPRKDTGPDACPFTTLYWDVLARDEKLLACDQRMTMQLRNLSRRSAADLRGIRRQADDLWGQLS